MKIELIEATTLEDAWYKTLYRCVEVGKDYTIDRGSYAGSRRKELDFLVVQINQPWHRPLLPLVPEGSSIEPPADEDYLNRYLSKIMTGVKDKNESYTYGERLTHYKVDSELAIETLRAVKGNKKGRDIYYCDIVQNKEVINLQPYTDVFLDQVQYMIHTMKTTGFHNNQLVLQVAKPDDCLYQDPPCLREIKIVVKEGKLWFFPNFRCLSGNTSLIYKNSKGDIFRSSIKDLYTKFIKNENYFISIPTPYGELNKWCNISSMEKSIKDNIITLSFLGAIPLSITKDHKVLTYSKNKFELKKVSYLKLGDVLLEPVKIPCCSEVHSHVDLFKLFSLRQEKIFVSNLLLKDFKYLKSMGIKYSESEIDKKRIFLTKVKNIEKYKNDKSLTIQIHGLGFNRNFEISNEMSYFIGSWLANGWYGKSSSLRLVIGDTNKHIKDRILKFLKDEFNYTPSIEKRRGCIVFNIGIRFLYILFKGLNLIHGAKDKYVPNIFFSMNDTIKKELYNGWFDNDAGCSSSYNLISDFSLICKLLGMPFSIYTEKPRDIYFKFENRVIRSSKSYKLHPLSKNNSRLVVVDQNGNSFLRRKIKDISLIERQEEVYDISIDTINHLFSCSNTGIIVHNSWDLYNGFPVNLAALQVLKEYMISYLDVGDGGMIATCGGAHLYEYVWEMARTLRGK